MAINNIKQLKEAGTQFYPETHIEAVIDGNGHSLDNILSDAIYLGTVVENNVTIQ